MSEPLLAHNVYFALTDNSEAAQAKLIGACKKHLSQHPGTVFFAVGTLAKDLRRPVNDRDFDVGLHILFQTQAAHDAYQAHPRHEQFVADNKSNWKKVRVFDSAVERV
jgi:stress responsive alpha/beta barrel protein